jgi:DNA-directed RNA polymerase subunit alpha
VIAPRLAVKSLRRVQSAPLVEAGDRGTEQKQEIMTDTTSTPAITLVAAAEGYGRFAIAPLEHGYGTTLGNALRRVLLSSIPGAAVTRIKIDGVFHEFAPIPYVREDVTELVLHIKGIRVRSYADRAVKLLLTRQNAGVVRAGDIDAPSTVEIVNPEHYICTLDSDAPLTIELTVERGRGASLADQRESGPIGEIAVDAIFSPIPKVNFVVEPLDPMVRAGAERLTLEIWTDSTIKPGDALSHAAAILAQYHQAIIDGVQPADHPADIAVTSPRIPAEVYDTPIDVLELSTRTYNALKRAGITLIGQLLELDDKALSGLRNMGQKSLEEIRAQLEARGYQTNAEGEPRSG